MKNYKNTIEEVYLATLACMPEGGHWSADDIEQSIRDWRDESDESDKLAAYLWTDEDIKDILDGVIELIEQNPDVSLIWYAVEMDEDDNDWGTGSYSLEEVKEMAEHMGAKYIAVIDGSECVQVIEMESEPNDIVANIYKNVFDSDIAQEKINSFVKAVIVNFGDERGDIIVENDNFGTDERYADFTEGRKKAGLHPMQIVFTGLEFAHICGDRYIGADDQIHTF